MKILVLADLHDDFWRETGRNPFEGAEDAIADLDALILAGDISNKPKARWKPALDRITAMLDSKKVHIFPGNHDFYNYRIDAEDRLKEFANNSGVNYVNRSSIHVGTTRFICTTLWTDFRLAPGFTYNKHFIPTRMNDYRAIRNASAGFRKLIPTDTIAIHKKDRDFIDKELLRYHDGETYVVTHHAPHPDVLVSYSENLKAAYASDLSELIKARSPSNWLFGHCHGAVSTSIHGCALENVSLGYPADVENPGRRIHELIRTID
jgi:Icc-related predicted phosphoesterase